MDKRYPLILILIFLVFSFSLSGFTWHKCCIDTVRGSGAYGTDIEVDSNGYPHIIYKEIYDKGLMYVRWDGSGWLYEDISESLLVKERGTSGMISLELDSFGYPHISQPGPRYTWKDASGWHRETGIDPGSHDNDYTSLRLDSQGYPHIAYNDKYYSGPDEYTGVRYCWKDGGGWHVNVVVIPDPEIVSVGEYGVSLALDSLELPHIIYSVGDNPDQTDSNRCTMGYAYKDLADIWHKEYIDSSCPCADWGHYVNIELDSLDRPMVAYGFGGADIDLKFAKKESGTWYSEYLDTVARPGYDVGLALNSRDEPYIVNASSDNWMYLNRKDIDGWHKERIDSITSGGALKSSSGIVIDKDGYIHISHRKSLGGLDDDRMWYATTHPTVGIEEEPQVSRGILMVSDFAVGNSLFVEWNTPESVKISLYDICGREIRQIFVGLERKCIRENISDISPGIYFIVLKSSRVREIKKVIVIK